MEILSRSRFLKQLGAAALAVVAGKPEAKPMTTTHLQRPVPRLRTTLPVVGMGTWQTFDTDDPAAKNRLREVLAVFHGAGGRLLDSSPMYGRAEAVLGELTGRGAGDYFLATKVWTTGQAAGVKQMETSLRLMGRVDLMQVHNLVDWRTHLKTLRAWKDAGRVRAIGITHYMASAFGDLEKIIRAEEIDFVQLPYSVALRDAERRLLPAARERRTATIINRPFEGGELFRAVRARPLPAAARDLGCESWGQVFLKFIISHPDVTCVIPATASPVHAADNLRAAFGPLPDSAGRETLARLLKDSP